MWNTEDAERVAKLAALELNENEKQQFAKQFSEILEYFQMLDHLEMTEQNKDRDETSMQLFRQDVSVTQESTPESFSPSVENGYFYAPRAFDSPD